MTKTTIEWTDFTVNPFRFRNLKTGKVGHHCTKISPGCANCYSSTMQTGPYLSGLEFTVENATNGSFFIDERALESVIKRKKPAKIFWCDMTDMFLENHADEWIDKCFAVMALTPQHTHQVLTKRSRRMARYFAEPDRRGRVEEAGDIGGACYANTHAGWPLPNVWLGVSVENQQYADERIPDLLATPAAVRFVSYEPALGPVDFMYPNTLFPQGPPMCCNGIDCGCRGMPLEPPLIRDMSGHGIDQIIFGGESGRCARPSDISWARQTIAQCKAAGVACFVKQLGSNPTGPEQSVPEWVERLQKKGGNCEAWPEDLRVRQFPTKRGLRR
jgi:protein gp37